LGEASKQEKEGSAREKQKRETEGNLKHLTVQWS